MLLRRLYSSIPSARAGSSTHPSKPHTSTRGRSKPSRNAIATRSSTSASPSATTPRIAPTRGRRKDRSGTLRSDDSGSSKLPQASDIPHPTSPNAFQPIRLYPAQMGMHLAFNPRHLPLPVHLGTKIYTSPLNTSFTRSGFDLGPFSSVPEMGSSDILNSLKAQEGSETTSSSGSNSSSVMSEHLRLLSTLSPPTLSHHLGPFSPFSADRTHTDLEGDTYLARTLGSSGVKHRLEMERDWEHVLGKLTAVKPAFTPSHSSSLSQPALKSDIDSAVASLNSLLTRLEIVEPSTRGRRRKGVTLSRSTGDDAYDEGWVNMDSVQRKRKKKINKHKYKKRRKATRAQRKRLGK